MHGNTKMKKEMKKVFIIIFIVILPLSLWAQALSSIQGRVTDKETGESLPGVNIVIESLHLGTVTNSKGEYRLNKIPDGKYSLSVSFIGYSTFKKQVSLEKGELVKLDFSIESHSENLNEVVVSAKSEARKIQELAMPISVITMKEIQGTVSDVSDVLSKTAGIKIRSSGGVGSATRISVRGLEGKRIGIFLDDAPISEQSDFVGINDIPIDLIERVEIYKGIVPARLGGSAIGGAVNIVLKEYPDHYMDASYSVQSFNTHKASAVFKRNNTDKGIEYGIGGFYTYSDNDYTMELPLNPGVSIKRDHDKFKKIVIGGGVTFTKGWFDEIEIEPAIVFTEKEIQGIEHNIQEAKSYADGYILENKNEKQNFLIEGLDLDFDNSYAYTIFRFQDKAMQRYNWDGTTYAPITREGGEVGFQPNDTYNQKHTFLQKTNLGYIINSRSSINFNLFGLNSPPLGAKKNKNNPS